MAGLGELDPLDVMRSGLKEQKEAELDSQRKQVTQQAIELFNSGDIRGALGSLAQINPEILNSTLAKQFLSENAPVDMNTIEGTSDQYAFNPRTGETKALGIGSRTQAMLNAEKAQAKAAGVPMAKPSAGQEAMDKEFGKNFADFVNQGGFSNVSKSLENLSVAEKLFKEGKGTGKVTGLLPDAAQDVLNPNLAKARDNIRDTVFQSLRLTLGAQFTEKEGERLVNSVFNPRLSTDENLRRLKALKSSLLEQAKVKQQAADYFRSNNGSLAGYEGPIAPKDPATLVNTILSNVAEKAKVETKTIGGKLYQKVPGGWVPVAME